jgi:uncharacterized protein (TIGR02271 family)
LAISAGQRAPHGGETSASVATLKRLRGRAGQHVAAAERSWDCPCHGSRFDVDAARRRFASDGRDVSGPTTDDAMTRSEEELRVGTTQRERGRARLRKHVVTEEVHQTVPAHREEVRVEREPITDANIDDALDGPAISEEEHEVTLHQEEVVTEKRAVPKERVRMHKETVTDEQEVSEELRKKQIETEGDLER